jgi:hypothetical protein
VVAVVDRHQDGGVLRDVLLLRVAQDHVLGFGHCCSCEVAVEDFELTVLH